MYDLKMLNHYSKEFLYISVACHMLVYIPKYICECVLDTYMCTLILMKTANDPLLGVGMFMF